jgi:hypothetical protein
LVGFEKETGRFCFVLSQALFDQSLPARYWTGASHDEPKTLALGKTAIRRKRRKRRKGRGRRSRVQRDFGGKR